MPPESEEARRARKKKEAKKAAAKKAAAAPAPTAPRAKGGLPSVGDGENRLLRETPFLCDFAFRTPLPLPPCGARLMPVPVDRSRLAAYRPFALWWQRPGATPLETELGMSLEPLDCDAYRVPPGPPPALHPDDAALLESEKSAAVKSKPKADKAAWLMRTLYLSDAQLPKPLADENEHARLLKSRRLAAADEAAPAARQAAFVEASFAAVEPPPVHATKPHLTATQVLPVLPDFGRWAEAFVHLQYDGDPLAELPYLEPAAAPPPGLRAAAAQGAFMKSYSLSGGEGAPPEKILVYFAPTEGGARAALAGDPAEAPRPCEWVREYSYETRDEAALLVLFLPPPGSAGAAHYITVPKRVALRRRVRAASREGGGFGVEQRPARVTLRKRPRTEEEAAQAAAVTRALLAPEEVEAEAEAAAAAAEETFEAAAFEGAEAAFGASQEPEAATMAAIFGDEDE